MKEEITSDSLILPDYSHYNESEFTKFSLEAIKEKMLPQIEEWLESSDPQLFISIDGLSGSGKSTLAKILSEIKQAHSNQFEIKTIGVDMFVATERDSKERHRMTDSVVSFWEKVYRRDIMKVFLAEVQSLGKKGGNIPVEDAYSHETGKLEFQTVDIPTGKKIILADGIDSTNIVDEVFPEEDRIRLFVFTPAEISLLSACCRDAEKKGVHIEERIMARIKEYTYLTMKLVETLLRPDVIVFDNTDGHRPLSEQFDNFKKIRQSQELITSF